MYTVYVALLLLWNLTYQGGYGFCWRCDSGAGIQVDVFIGGDLDLLQLWMKGSYLAQLPEAEEEEE